MPLLLVLLFSFAGSSYAAGMTKEFACYSAMNKPSRSENFLLGQKVVLHPVNGFSFFALSENSLQNCRVPAKASPAPDADPKVGPWLLQLQINNTPYHFQYPQPAVHKHLKGAPPFLKPECTEIAGAKQAEVLAAILENRIAEARQSCPEGRKYKKCLGAFVERLRKCEGIDVIATYVYEIGRSAKVHAQPASTRGSANPDGMR